MSKLTVRLGKLELRNPTILASGILCSGSLLKRAAIESGAGAVVTKSLTMDERGGYPTPVIVGVNEGLVNAVGLANQGYEGFLSQELSLAKGGKIPVFVSVAGSDSKEFRKICVRAEEAGADAVELNLSCPHVKKHGLEMGADPITVRKLVKEVKGTLKIPVHVKLGLSDSLKDSAIAAQDSGADAVVAINTIRAMAIDVHARKPVLSHVYGGLSGPAIHPIALRCVHELYEHLSIPIVGCGGVEDWQGAIRFMLAGATSVQIGSAVATRGVEIFGRVAKGIERYLDAQGFKNLDEVIGSVHR
ncbi:MAG TPA: dihydroorotate dehydrogenase [Hadesarchaea archaeon]|nr:dihydroorotate dehydrogenase [Hadesarchaea archaeon]